MYDNYDFDSRVVAGRKEDWFKSINQKTMKAIVEVDETDKEVSFKFEVCPTCNGRGSHVNPSIDCGGITQEDFNNDPSFASDYMDGVYHVPCYQCKGKNVVPVCNDSKYVNYLQELQEELDEMEEIYAAERRMGA